MTWVDRHPVVVSVIFVAVALVLAGSAAALRPNTHPGWVWIVWLVLLVYGIGLSVMAYSGWGRRRFAGQIRAISGRSALLLAIAASELLIGVVAVVLGASLWLMWLTFGVVFVLVSSWCYEQLRELAKR